MEPDERLDRAAAAGGVILARIDPWADQSSQTSRSILRAALDSFANRGFSATTLRHIAAGSGLSTAALYVHFRSKEQLLFEISRRGHAAALEVVEEASLLDDPIDGLLTLLYAFPRWHAEERTTARVVQYELGSLGIEFNQRIVALRRDTERIARSVVERGVLAAGAPEPDIRGVATAVLSLGIDVARWYSESSPYSPDDLGRLYCRLGARLVGLELVDRPPAR